MANKDTARLVERELGISPRARQEDKWLQLAVWYQQGLILTDEQTKLFLSDKISTPESIGRTRRKLQEAGKYLAPKPVREARKALAEQTREQVRQEKQGYADAFDDMFGNPLEQTKWW